MAYEVDKLVGKLKDGGLDLAEDAAKHAATAVLDWVAESALESENKFDDLLAAIIPVVKPVVMEQLDGIDGKEG